MILSYKEACILKQAYDETLFKVAVGSPEAAADQALQYLQMATKDSSYLDRVWKWMNTLKEKMGTDFNKFLDIVKKKGASLLQQLGVTEGQLASIGGSGSTTYAKIHQTLKIAVDKPGIPSKPGTTTVPGTLSTVGGSTGDGQTVNMGGETGGDVTPEGTTEGSPDIPSEGVNYEPPQDVPQTETTESGVTQTQDTVVMPAFKINEQLRDTTIPANLQGPSTNARQIPSGPSETYGTPFSEESVGANIDTSEVKFLNEDEKKQILKEFESDISK